MSVFMTHQVNRTAGNTDLIWYSCARFVSALIGADPKGEFLARELCILCDCSP